MDTYSIIKQLTEQLSNSPLEEERIRALIPIDHVMDIDSEGFVFHCQFNLSDDQNTISSQIRDLNLITIEDEELYKVLAEIGKVDFTEYLNKEIFNYIQSKYQIANKKGAWDKTNMWFEPNIKFLEWFDLKAIDLSKSAPLEKQPTIPNSDTQKKPKGGRPKGLTKRTISRYIKVYHQFEILKEKYSNKTKAELYELLATRDYDGKSYKRKTIRNIIEDKKYNLIPSQ